jgi:hypothetical protein
MIVSPPVRRPLTQAGYLLRARLSKFRLSGRMFLRPDPAGRSRAFRLPPAGRDRFALLRDVSTDQHVIRGSTKSARDCGVAGAA